MVNGLKNSRVKSLKRRKIYKSKCKIYKNKVTRNKLAKKKKLIKSKKGGSIIMYKIYADDDDTIKPHKNRCMCVNYKMKNNNFTLKHNKKEHRCKNNVEHNSDFCKEHQECNNFLRKYLSGYEVEYNKEWEHPYIEGSHNCYTYFLNDRMESVKERCEALCLKKYKKGCPKKIDECRNMIPQPSDYSILLKYGNLKNKSRKYKCDAMQKKIMDDNNLIPTSLTKKCPTNYYKGAMVVDPDHTFHFYRQDKNGLWSHKPGTMPVNYKDASGKNIYVPHFADRNYLEKHKNDGDPDGINYTDFCGYYCIPTNEYALRDSI